MAGTLGYIILSVVSVLLAISYPSLDALYRTGNLLQPLPSPSNLKHCKLHTELSACEDIAVHNGWAFLACGDPARRLRWWPPMDIQTNTDTSTPLVDDVYAYEYQVRSRVVSTLRMTLILSFRRTASSNLVWIGSHRVRILFCTVWVCTRPVMTRTKSVCFLSTIADLVRLSKSLHIAWEHLPLRTRKHTSMHYSDHPTA